MFRLRYRKQYLFCPKLNVWDSPMLFYVIEFDNAGSIRKWWYFSNMSRSNVSKNAVSFDCMLDLVRWYYLHSFFSRWSWNRVKHICKFWLMYDFICCLIDEVLLFKLPVIHKLNVKDFDHIWQWKYIFFEFMYMLTFDLDVRIVKFET